MTTTVTRVVESDAFSEVWATATRAAHRALVGAATSDGGGLVVRTDEGVGIQLGAVVERVKQNLVDRGLGVAELIPTVDRWSSSAKATTSRRSARATRSRRRSGFWLPFITLALFGLGILIARRRSAAILGTGHRLRDRRRRAGRRPRASAPPRWDRPPVRSDSRPTRCDVIYEQLVGNMTQTALVLALLGVLIAVLGWVMGRSRSGAGLPAHDPTA